MTWVTNEKSVTVPGEAILWNFSGEDIPPLGNIDSGPDVVPLVGING